MKITVANTTIPVPFDEMLPQSERKPESVTIIAGDGRISYTTILEPDHQVDIELEPNSIVVIRRTDAVTPE